MGSKPLMLESRGVTLRDFLIFQLKLALDGLADFVVFNASIVAIVLDFIAGRGRRPRLFYSVVRVSERFGPVPVTEWSTAYVFVKCGLAKDDP